MPDSFDDFHAEPVTVDGHVTVAVRGELDLATVGEFQAALERTWETPERPVVVDLSELRFIDSTGLRAVLLFHKRARESGREYRLTGADTNVRRTLEISGLDQVFVIEELPPTS